MCELRIWNGRKIVLILEEANVINQFFFTVIEEQFSNPKHCELIHRSNFIFACLYFILGLNTCFCQPLERIENISNINYIQSSHIYSLPNI